MTSFVGVGDGMKNGRKILLSSLSVLLNTVLKSIDIMFSCVNGNAGILSAHVQAGSLRSIFIIRGEPRRMLFPVKSPPM